MEPRKQTADHRGIEAYRGSLLDFTDDPATSTDPSSGVRFIEDGLLLIQDQRILASGPTPQLSQSYPELEPTDYRGKLILPGFIDCHLHYPQMAIIGSYGEALLPWLERYTFPAESRFAHSAHCTMMAELFVQELLRNGTSTALVMASSHPQGVESLFAAAERRGMRLISGLTMMDRGAPSELLLSPEKSRQEASKLIKRWHKHGRLSYAISPRFALTSTREGLRAAAALRQEFPDTLLHTHLAENTQELARVAELFPEARNYLDVYRQAELVGPGSVFAHGIHLSEEEHHCLAENRATLVHCPSSNLFLGSGLCNVAEALRRGITVGLGSDVGAGTSFSLLKTMAEAYKISTFHRSPSQGPLSPFQAFYMATLGGAKCLGLDQVIGNFTPGKEADFIVLDPRATPIQALRCEGEPALEELLFSLLILGDDRSVVRTHIAAD